MARCPALWARIGLGDHRAALACMHCGTGCRFRMCRRVIEFVAGLVLLLRFFIKLWSFLQLKGYISQ
jgi:hypothetical protein